MIYFDLFFVFFKIGLFTFGGGLAMIPLIQQEVIRNGWLTQDELIDFIAISESTPGPLAVNVSTFVGTQVAGITGGLCSTFGVVLPSFIIILLVAGMYDRFRKSNIVKGALVSLKGVVVGLIASAVISTAGMIFSESIASQGYAEVVIGAGMLVVFLYVLYKKVNPIIVIIASAVIGIIVKSLI